MKNVPESGTSLDTSLVPELKVGKLSGAIDTGASVGVSVVVAWAWNSMYPDSPMPAEVAAGLGAILGPMVEDLRRLRRDLFDRWLGD